MPQETSLKQLAEDIYSNKPIFFTLLALAGVAVYLLYQQFFASSPAPAVAPAAPANTPSGNTISNSYTTVTVNRTGAGEPVTPAPPSTTAAPPTPQPGPIVAPPAPAGSKPPYPGGVISQHGSVWSYGNPPNNKPLAPLFPAGTTFKGGSGGSAWYTEPGQNQQYLTKTGYGYFSS